MKITYRKTEPSTGHTSEFKILDEDGNQLGRLFRRETSKTGFRRGRCVGQVRVMAWFYQLGDSPVQGGSKHFGGAPKFRTKKKAEEQIAVDLATQGKQ